MAREVKISSALINLKFLNFLNTLLLTFFIHSLKEEKDKSSKNVEITKLRCSEKFHAIIMGNFVQAVSMDSSEEGQQTSSMVDDTFFIVKKSVR